MQSLLEELSGFSRRLNAYLTNPTMTSAATVNMASERGLYDACKRGGQSEDAVSSQEQLQATVDTRWARLDSSLEVGINAGYIDWAQALRLEAELEKISEDEYHFLQDGRLSYREANQIIADLDALETQITTLQSAFNRSRRARFGNRSQSPALLAR